MPQLAPRCHACLPRAFAYVWHAPLVREAISDALTTPSIVKACCRLRAGSVLCRALLVNSDAAEAGVVASPCLQVLAGVADGLLPLEEAGEVLRDALSVLSCKEIKVRGCPKCARLRAVL